MSGASAPAQVPFPPNASAEVLAENLTLDLGTASIGGVIGSVEVTETVTPGYLTLSEQLQVFDICEEVCREQTTNPVSLAGLQSLTSTAQREAALRSSVRHRRRRAYRRNRNGFDIRWGNRRAFVPSPGREAKSSLRNTLARACRISRAAGGAEFGAGSCSVGCKGGFAVFACSCAKSASDHEIAGT